MGCASSHAENTATIKKSSPTSSPKIEAEEAELEIQSFALMKDAPGCTGMFWRANPRNGKKGSNDNWPRDGAQLKGIVHEVQGAKWLECSWLASYSHRQCEF